MNAKNENRQRQAFYLLLACVFFACLGLAILFFGALSHINPNVSIAGLFSRESFMNLVYSIVPPLQ